MNSHSSFGSDGKLADERVGTVLADRYRIDALVGEGGMGRVYAAEHVLMRKRVAIKILHSDLTRVPELVARFEREAMAAAHIENPNVATATDFGKLPDGSVFLVLEFVQGKSLRDEIATGPLGVERSLIIARQIAFGLGSAHSLDIVHRDLKPENVMLVQKGQNPDFVKILDFGIAKVPVGDAPSSTQPRSGRPSMPSLTKAGMVFGTPEYMSPEQALGQPVDGRADLYALGVILFEMLAGVRPFSSQSSVGILGQQLSKPPPKFAERAQGILIPPSVEQLVHRLLARDLGDRFQRAEEVVQAIDALVQPLPGRGPVLFTIPDGSPAAVSGGPPSIPDTSPIDIGMSPPIPARRTPPIRRATRIGVERARDTWVKFLVWAERTRGKLPAKTQDKLKGIPTQKLLVALSAAGLLVFLLGILGFVAVFAGSEAPAPVSSVVPSASAPAAGSAPEITVAPPTLQEELDAAAKKGTGAVESLAAKHPKNGRIVLELARLHAERKDYPKAVGAVGRALSIDLSLKDDPLTPRILAQTAQSRSTSEASFTLLQGPMEARGADVIYELAVDPNSKPWVKARAEKWLTSEAFQKVSSPAVNVASAFRFASSCEQNYALLLRAKNVGDERCLPYLEILKNTAGCGGDKTEDCYPCLRKDQRLADAIAGASSRKKPKF